MTSGELFDLFCGGQTTVEEVYGMTITNLHRQIKELRADEPDEIDMTDGEIADEIYRYATAEVLDL